MDRPLAILAALPQELALLRAALADAETSGLEPLTAWRGKLDGRDVVIAEAGIGKVASAMGATYLIAAVRPQLLIFTGVAGGLDPALSVGDVVIAERLIQHDFGVAGLDGLAVYQAGRLPFYNPTDELGFATDPDLLQTALSTARAIRLTPIEPGGPTPRVVAGTILTGDTFVDSARLRDDLHRRFEAVAVEMEGAAVAQVARAFGVRFLVVRSLSDLAGAEAPSPEAFAHFLETAATNSARVVRALLSVV